MPELDRVGVAASAAYRAVLERLEFEAEVWAGRGGGPNPHEALLSDARAGLPLDRPARWVDPALWPDGCSPATPLRLWADGTVERLTDPATDGSLSEFGDL